MSGVRPHLLVDLQRPGLTESGIDRVLRSLSPEDLTLPARFGSVRILLNERDRKRCASLLDASWRISSDENPIAEANLSLAAAATEGAALLVSSGATAPSATSLTAMERVLDRDPYFAFASARVSVYADDLVAKLDPSLGDPTLATIPANAIHALPEFHLIADQLFEAVLIDAKIVAGFEALKLEYETLWGAFRELIAQARRVGFRCVVANRALVSLPDDAMPRNFVEADRSKIQDRFPETARLDEEWADSGLHRYESLLGRAFSSSPRLRKTLLLDLSDLGALFNGTSEAVIGLLWGLKASGSDWQISLLVSPEVVDFHGLDRSFPDFQRVWPEPQGRYTAVFRPIQPWSLAQLERLHHLALFVFVMMFDTITNETRTGVVPRGLDKVWELLAKSADGLLYISRFTRDRFRIRFPLDASVDECVPSLSSHPGDYCIRPSECNGNYIFIVGNGYPHKWMETTLNDLVEAFPYQPFKALGYEAPHIPQLSGLKSGQASHDAIDQYYSESKLIVFPSQYEGFGFPVIRGLSHAKTVIARRSDLLDELAANYRGPGRLLAYETRTELVELLARVLHGLEVETLPLGTDLAPNAEPAGQIEVAARVLSFIESRVDKPASSNWARRESIFDAVGLARWTTTE